MIIGKPNNLQFDLSLSEHDRALGCGSLRAFVGKYAIWSDEEQRRGISWTWIDLLEQLARSWRFLKFEESTPSGEYDWQALLREGRILQRDSDLDEPSPESTKESYIFVRRHNLASGIEGLYLPSLSLLREGRRMWVVSSTVTKLFDLSETLDTLSLLGDQLANSIAAAEAQERSLLAVQAWRNREPTRESALRIQLGSAALRPEFIPSGETLFSYLEAENDDAFESSLLIAARMSAEVPIHSRRLILDALKRIPPRTMSAELDALSREAQSAVPNYTRLAYQQGAALAQWTRNKLGLAPDVKADPETVLQRLGVEITKHQFGTDVIDAVGCWGRNHGPAVLVNIEGEHAQADAGRRATLAHELAHVLFDRNGSLPAAEVFGGTVPRYPEQRANAFAAEFLLPQRFAIECLKSSDDQVATLRWLSDHFEVSHELAGRHISNGSFRLDDEAHELLNSWIGSARKRSYRWITGY